MIWSEKHAQGMFQPRATEEGEFGHRFQRRTILSFLVPGLTHEYKKSHFAFWLIRNLNWTFKLAFTWNPWAPFPPEKKVIYVVAEKMKVPHMKSSFIQDSSCAIGKGFFSKNNSNTSVKIQPLLYLAVLALQCLQLKISLTLVRWEVSVVGLTPSFSYYLPTCF